MYQIVKNDDSGLRLDRWLKENLQDITYVEIQKLIRTGQVRVDGGRKKQNYRVNSGEKVRFPPKFTRMNNDLIKNMSKNIAFTLEEIKIYEDDSLIVINKPYGLSTQGGTKVKYHIDGLLSIENENDKNNYRLVHRLDKYTSGALIVAKKRESASFYTQKFLSKQIKKTYLALTRGVPDTKTGVISFPLEKSNQKKMSKNQNQFQDAVTQYEVIETTKDRISLIKLEPITGRKHQIRKHLSMLKAPIIGDTKYGNDNALDNTEKRFYLHSYKIEFPRYSDGQNILIKAEIPQYFEEAISTLGIQINE
tara:strand:- start:3082 stop:4002 length:921 start_codon:yes stop_codon:yes gene_type:complete